MFPNILCFIRFKYIFSNKKFDYNYMYFEVRSNFSMSFIRKWNILKVKKLDVLGPNHFKRNQVLEYFSRPEYSSRRFSESNDKNDSRMTGWESQLRMTWNRLIPKTLFDLPVKII